MEGIRKTEEENGDGRRGRGGECENEGRKQVEREISALWRAWSFRNLNRIVRKVCDSMGLVWVGRELKTEGRHTEWRQGLECGPVGWRSLIPNA